MHHILRDEMITTNVPNDALHTLFVCLSLFVITSHALISCKGHEALPGANHPAKVLMTNHLRWVVHFSTPLPNNVWQQGGPEHSQKHCYMHLSR